MEGPCLTKCGYCQIHLPDNSAINHHLQYCTHDGPVILAKYVQNESAGDFGYKTITYHIDIVKVKTAGAAGYDIVIDNDDKLTFNKALGKDQSKIQHHGYHPSGRHII